MLGREDKISDSLTLVVPAYNEAECLPKVFPELLAYCKRRDWKLIVVNDGSTDTTRQILDGYRNFQGLKILHHKVNRGYGAALKTGIAHVDTEFVCTIDSDGQHQLHDVDKLLRILLETDADTVIGRRKDQKAGNLYRAIGKWIIRKIAGFLLPITIHDLNSGLKLHRTQLAQRYMQLCPDSMAFSDVITLIFISQQHLVVEHPVVPGERFAGRSTISTRTAFETVLEVLNIVMLFNPMRIFLPMAFIFTLSGIIWGLPIVLSGRGVSVGAVLAIITGAMCFFLGLLAEQLSLIRKDKILFNEGGLKTQTSNHRVDATVE